MEFVLGIRYYLKGLAIYQIIKSLYDNTSLLKGRTKFSRITAALQRYFVSKIPGINKPKGLLQSPL